MPARNTRKRGKLDNACEEMKDTDVKSDTAKRSTRQSINSKYYKDKSDDVTATNNPKVDTVIISPAAKLAAKRYRVKANEEAICHKDDIEKESSKYFVKSCNVKTKRGRSRSVIFNRGEVQETAHCTIPRSRSVTNGRGGKCSGVQTKASSSKDGVSDGKRKTRKQQAAKKAMMTQVSKKEMTAVDAEQPSDVIELQKEVMDDVVHDVEPSSSGTANANDGNHEEMSDSESDWDEVEEVALAPDDSQIPMAPVEIVLQEPDIMKKKRKKSMDPETYFRQLMNRFRKATQLDVHKVHLLCLLSHGFHRNAICNDDMLRSVALSIVPTRFVDLGTANWDTKQLVEITHWFHNHYRIDAAVPEDNSDIRRTLLLRLECYIVASEAELVFLFVLTLRALGLAVRTLCSFHPVTFKANDLILTAVQKCNAMKKQATTASKSQKLTVKKMTKRRKSPCGNVEKAKPHKAISSTSTGEGLSLSPLSGDNLAVENDKDDHVSEAIGMCRHSRRCSSKVVYREGDEEMEEGEGELGGVKDVGKRKGQTKRKSSDTDYNMEEWMLYFPNRNMKKHAPSDSEESVTITKVTNNNGGIDYWTEVYMDESWTCVDCVSNRVGSPEEMEPNSARQFSFVLAYDSEGHIKDMTRRYAHDWLLHTQKLRGDARWLDAVLKPYEMTAAESNQKEEELLQAKLLEQPLPKAISDYKNHPLYVLKRHLLKFEAIYPNSAVPLGFVRNDPVYARECVHMLHARETWLKEGLVVKKGEEPYKMVKARPKWHKPQAQSSEPTLAIFGRWQTEPYVPPPAVDGKVPRNEYANVELFKPSMLPAGTVHLQLPGLQKIAKKLDIDCAPAMVGWEFHMGYNHPTMDGYIVCTEHKDILLAAWDEQQEIDREKRVKEREQQAVDNWKLLTKGLLIKERLKARYQLQETDTKVESKAGGAGISTGKKQTKSQTKSNDVALSWPQNKQQAAARKAKKQSKQPDSHMFPFEVEQEKL